jgi:hypothetical protein
VHGYYVTDTDGYRLAGPFADPHSDETNAVVHELYQRGGHGCVGLEVEYLDDSRPGYYVESTMHGARVAGPFATEAAAIEATREATLRGIGVSPCCPLIVVHVETTEESERGARPEAGT